MHEHHAVEGIVKKITEEAKSRGASKITKVTLVIGGLSGFEESSVRLYFGEISKGTSAEGAELIVKTGPEKTETKLYIESIEIEEEDKK